MVRLLKHWASHALAYDRQWKHIHCFTSEYAELPDIEVMEGLADTLPDPTDTKTDIELDAGLADNGRGRGRGRGRVIGVSGVDGRGRGSGRGGRGARG